MRKRHPYQEYEELKVWKVLERGLKNLHANGDIVETTARPYIVGYLSKLLDESGLLSAPTAAGASTHVEEMTHPDHPTVTPIEKRRKPTMTPKARETK